MFLNNQVLGVEVGWNIRDTDDCGKVFESVKRCQTDNSFFLFSTHTFSFAWGSGDVAGAFLEVDYIASDKLGNLARSHFIFHMDFT